MARGAEVAAFARIGQQVFVAALAILRGNSILISGGFPITVVTPHARIQLLTILHKKTTDSGNGLLYYCPRRRLYYQFEREIFIYMSTKPKRGVTMNSRTIWFAVLIFCWTIAISPVAIAQESAGANAFVNETSADTGTTVDLSSISTLDLETAVRVALSGNPGLDAALARARQAKAQVKQARAAYWPWLDVNASGARVELSDDSYEEKNSLIDLLNPGTTIDDPDESYKADLTASWTLFDGFERKFTNAKARYGEHSSTAALKDTRRLLISSVASSYFSAQLASENIAIAKADEEFNQRQLVDAEARQHVGSGSLSDVLNFQVRKNDAKTTLIKEEYEYEIALYGLAALLGLPESRLPGHVQLSRLAPETEAELTQPPVEKLIVTALNLRPDIQQTQWSIKQAEAQIKIAQSDYYPSIDVSGALEGERTGNGEFEKDNFGNRIQVSLSYNIFSGGLTRSQVSEARHRKTELEKSLRELTLSVNSDIRSSAALVATAQTQLALQRENVELVQRTRDLVEKEYNAGQGSLVRLNEAQRDVTAAQSNLALALVALRQAWIELETRAGIILARYAAQP
jgi:outer membrane protein